MSKDSYEIVLTAKKVRQRKKRVRIVKLVLLILAVLLVALYAVLKFINSGYFFMISLDKNLYLKNGVIIYDDPNYKVYRRNLKVESMDFLDYISVKWLPDNLDEGDGSHNGQNYVAYSFYIENTGKDAVDYWTDFIIDDAIKNVDEAIRIRIYFDGKYVDYAKASITGEAEPGTVKFLSDDVVFQDSIKNFKPDEIHRYTIVIWLEGSDLECTNDILGGEIRAHMNFKSEVRESGEK